MAKCTLRIEIDSPKEQYVPGDTVDATVYVETTDSVSCNDLSLELGWRIHGKGNRDSNTLERETLFAGQWSPGQEESYRTQMVVPPLSSMAPASYHGHHINVDWYLQARADIPWAIDPKAEERIFVAPDAQVVPDYEEPGIWPTAPVKLTGKSGCLIFFMVIALAGGVAGLFIEPWLLVPFAALGLAATLAFLKEKALRERIGDVGFGFAPERPAIGGELHGFVQIAPPGRLDVESVTMALSATEVAVSGSGTQETTHRHVAFTKSSVQAEHHTVESGDMLELDFPFPIRADLPPTFKANNNRVDWVLRVEVKVQGAKKLTSTKQLRMGHASYVEPPPE